MWYNNCEEKARMKVKGLMGKMKRLPGNTWGTLWNPGREDPRRLIHALKVGLSLTLVSLLYLIEPLYKTVGQNAVWAVMTVVVVLEFTAGATLCKGLNRGLGTLLAGSLAFGIEYVAQESGHVFRAMFIGGAVFLIGFASTYIRFIPYIKKNYDYGVVIFLLTFNLITVSSYRVDNVLKLAHQRSLTIAMGCGICLLMCLLFFPNWSGEDLHNNTVFKLQGLAKSIQACVNEYFNEDEKEERQDKSLSEDPIYKGYKSVLDSKSIDETLAVHASWEPRHSRHCRFPWQQYVKLGDTLRHFGYTLVALHGCLQTEIQTPKSIRAMFKDPCTRLAAEVSQALSDLADSIRRRRHLSPGILSDHLHQSLHDLNVAIKSQPKLFLGPFNKSFGSNKKPTAPHSGPLLLSSVKTDTSALMEWRNRRAVSGEGCKTTLRPTLSKMSITSLEFSEALPFAAFASLLVEAVARLDLIIEEVEDLARVANFKEYVPPALEVDDPEKIVVTCEKGKEDKRAMQIESNLPSHGTE
ncbi:aluminum-activated malate transporter 12 [Impatiens glandulifera]|uniref:aluminum-activated malate transporter 12 n=1 Tax=Impatiens glandulifera TaxID=253017 RepID=UPI001FB0E837|nr:aluminum-activated malate transporter 12 [Impatiens glandulifera]